jgi:hypothetical protein
MVSWRPGDTPIWQWIDSNFVRGLKVGWFMSTILFFNLNHNLNHNLIWDRARIWDGAKIFRGKNLW